MPIELALTGRLDPMTETQAATEAPGAITATSKILTSLQPMDDAPITPEWCMQLQQRLEAASWLGVGACARVLPATQLLRVFAQASALLKAEPTLLEVRRQWAVACNRELAAAGPHVITLRLGACGARARPPHEARRRCRLGCALPRRSGPSEWCPRAPPPQLDPAGLGSGPVTVVGDTHGQYHDVLRLFQTAGHPSKDRVYIFNGRPSPQ